MTLDTGSPELLPAHLPDQVWGLILVAGLFSLLVGGLIAALEGYVVRHRLLDSGDAEPREA